MKRILILLLLLSMLCACSKTPLSAEETMLHSGKWQCTNDECTYSISFEDGDFSCACSCGSHLNLSNAETYRYNKETHNISILDSSESVIENGTIIYLDDFYLIIQMSEETFIYANQNKKIPESLTDVTCACLTILSYEENVITVSSCNYDKDASDSFCTWKLSAAPSLLITGTDVVLKNDTVISSNSGEIPINELEYYFYNNAYFHFDENGNVDRIDFYGQTIIT